MRQAVLLGPPKRGVAGCTEIAAVFPDPEHVAGVVVVVLGRWIERPQEERDAAARKMFAELVTALRHEFTRVIIFAATTELAAAACERWPCPVTAQLRAVLT